MTKSKIPKPAIERLCTLYRFLDMCEEEGTTCISSAQIEKQLHIGSHNVRKDISYLNLSCSGSGGYNIKKLKSQIAAQLGFTQPQNICIVGLGRLGTAILAHERIAESEYNLAAGFDSNINKLETIRTRVPVFPSYEIESVVRQMNITLAIIAVPADAAQSVADKLIGAGIRGIVNFAPVVIKTGKSGVFINNVDILGKLNLLTALLKANSSEIYQ
ncbi:redox-sensing transcriptional repressor Rex [candidate division KSB1 bacterium]|nr:redox-sensing transcriptional repressor Rex [candidate division KSB1 bacterium]